MLLHLSGNFGKTGRVGFGAPNCSLPDGNKFVGMQFDKRTCVNSILPRIEMALDGVSYAAIRMFNGKAKNFASCHFVWHGVAPVVCRLTVNGCALSRTCFV